MIRRRKFSVTNQAKGHFHAAIDLCANGSPVEQIAERDEATSVFDGRWYGRRVQLRFWIGNSPRQRRAAAPGRLALRGQIARDTGARERGNDENVETHDERSWRISNDAEDQTAARAMERNAGMIGLLLSVRQAASMCVVANGDRSGK